MLKYTICLIKRNNKILMLNRNKAPNMGMWNGVGGKIEKNESPSNGVKRETFEETSILLDEIIFAGNAVWKSNRGDSGMHIFIAELPDGVNLITPIQVEEGILEWKEIDWILNPDNKGIVSNMKMYLPKILEGNNILEHRFTYKDGVMTSYESYNLTEEEINNINLNHV